MEYLESGIIIKTVGLKGELKVKSSTYFAEERYQKGNNVYIRINGVLECFKVFSYRNYSGFDYLILEEVNSLEIAEKLCGLSIFIKKDEHEVEEGFYYFDDLIGCEVINNADHNVIGKVIKVEEFPAQATLLIKTINNKNLYIPFLNVFVPYVDVTNKKITVNLIGGMEI